MNIIKFERYNQINGDGLRCVIWCAGCSHHCLHCHNPETWDPNQGTPVGDWIYEALKEQLDKEEISGVTFSGGEVTFPSNREEGTRMMKWIKKNYPNKTIWVYTGFLYEDIKDLEMMDYIDVLIDGPYEESLNPGRGKLLWRGSLNQRILRLDEIREKRSLLK